ncbi:hypothetical protein EDD16DRAFT_1483116, partial [Pisolithus croceorrhizus]
HSCPFTSVGTQPGSGTPMEIGATSSSCLIPSHIKCFTCRGNHYKCNCTSHSFPSPSQPSALSYSHQAATPEDLKLSHLHQMSFKEMQVFFYDKQINEMKEQGKEFGQ